RDRNVTGVQTCALPISKGRCTWPYRIQNSGANCLQPKLLRTSLRKRSPMLEVDEKSLKHGVLTLVVTLVEVIQEALEIQAIRRLEGGDLTEEEQNRLGEALMELDEAMDEIKAEHGITASVTDLHRGLDDVVDEVVDKLINPARWAEEAQGSPSEGKPTQ